MRSGINVTEDSTDHSTSKGISASTNRFQSTTMELQVQVARQQFTTHDDIGEFVSFSGSLAYVSLELADTKATWPASEDNEARETHSTTKRASTDLFPDSDSAV